MMKQYHREISYSSCLLTAGDPADEAQFKVSFHMKVFNFTGH
jgi:hypothetical protein